MYRFDRRRVTTSSSTRTAGSATRRA